MRTRAGRVFVFQSVVVVVFDRFALWVKCKGPEAVKMDLLTETSGHRVHEETSGRTLYVDIVGQPVPVDKDIQHNISSSRKTLKLCKKHA